MLQLRRTYVMFSAYDIYVFWCLDVVNLTARRASGPWEVPFQLSQRFPYLTSLIVQHNLMKLREKKLVISGTDLISLLVLFLLGTASSNKPKATSFQIGSGWNLAGLFLQSVTVNWRIWCQTFKMIAVTSFYEKPKAPSFQNRLGWNSAGMFFR